jgi:deazaflavin-dependent oxidoreductase (nitroreductase family)
MTLDKPPSGTRGARTPPRLLGRIMMPLMLRIHRRSGDRFSGMDLLYLTTVGARSGQSRTTALARFDDGQGGWLIVASAAGAAQHPAWYHNIAAHPDQVSVEVAGTSHRVSVEQVEGPARDQAWASITGQAPRYNTYLDKTDRHLPVLRLTSIP